MNRIVIKNFFYAFGAQVVSLIASLFVTFFIPSVIGVKQFAYWQLFLTYVTYVNISRLGINDGLYLRLGGKHYDDLDFVLLSHERQVYVGYQMIVAALFATGVMFLDIEPDRKFVLYSCAVCIVIVNANGYLIYVLQAVNRTSVYSTSVVLQNLTWFLAVGIICICRVYSYKVIILMYVCGHLCASVYLMLHARKIVKHQYTSLEHVIWDIKENIKCGIKLMIATYAGSFIVSSVRMIVDAAWGVEIFGVFSFSLTLSNVFLTFISQVSIVVFPALRKVKDKELPRVYKVLRDSLSIILPLLLVGYLPIVIIVRWVLPEYVSSLEYLPFFLPICVFDGKMQMMCSSFFKSMRKESILLFINMITLGCSILIAVMGAFFIKNIYFVATGILIVIAFRSIMSEMILAKYMNHRIIQDLAQEIILVVLFVYGALSFEPTIMFAGYGILYFVYLVINRNKVKQLVSLKR